MKYFIHIFSICMLMTLTGCHSLHNYNSELEKYPEVEDLDAEGIVVSSMTPEEIKARDDELRKVQNADYPPYRIDSGDLLRLVVYNHEDLNAEILVTPDGYVGIPFVGQIKIQGKTLPQAVEVITNGLTPYLKNFVVGLAPVATPSQLATIGGCVTHPGRYEARSNIRLGDLFSMAGSGRTQLFNGQEVDMADLQNAVFLRDGKALPIDFEAALVRGDKLHNIPIYKGDYVYIPSRTDAMVSVFGAVGSPRYLTWNPKMRFLDALANSGGLAPEYWRYGIIIRGGIANPVYYRVNIDEVLAGIKQNPLLKTGDMVYIPMDGISYYNAFIRKLLPTGALYNMSVSPITTRNALESN